MYGGVFKKPPWCKCHYNIEATANVVCASYLAAISTKHTGDGDTNVFPARVALAELPFDVVCASYSADVAPATHSADVAPAFYPAAVAPASYPVAEYTGKVASHAFPANTASADLSTTLEKSHLFRIELCNIRSVSNKCNVVSSYLSTLAEVDLLFLTETWLKPKHNDSMFCPDGYQAIRCDRIGSRGGGVAVLYNNNLQVAEVDITLKKDNNFQIVCIDVHNRDSLVRLCCVYLPPTQSDTVVNDLCKTLKYVLSVSFPVFIFGDFNFPHVDWSVPCNNGDSAHGIFLNFCSFHALYQSVHFPTHDKGNILDLVLCNQQGSNLLYNTTSQAPPWDTDHFLVCILLNFFPSKHVNCNVQSPNFDKANYDSILASLTLVEWDAIFAESSSDIQSLYDNFISILNNCISDYIPLKSKQLHKPKTNQNASRPY